MIWSTLGDDQPNAATKYRPWKGLQSPGEQMCNDSLKVPYNMQNPEVRSSRNQNFGNNMEALQNAKPGSFFSRKNGFGTKCMAQEDLGV